MEKELNIAAILKDKPNARLYDELHNIKVELDKVSTINDVTTIWCKRELPNKVQHFGYSERGTERGWLDGLQILKPSKEMQDWSKFAWKKGDVLKVATGGDSSCVFDRFTNDDYTEFTGVFDKYLDRFDCFTSDWCKVTDKKEHESIIQRIETQYGGKLNLDTLKIEKPQFKDGDIIKHGKNIYIVQNFTDSYVHIYAGLIGKTGEVITRRLGISSNFGCSNLATDSEKQQLFDALAKENKAWDAEKKAIVDLPKKCKFKAFDKVLVRDTKDEYWRPAFFASLDEDSINEYVYCLIGDPDGVFCKYCIPYNEQTAHLLGTTDDWKGSE